MCIFIFLNVYVCISVNVNISSYLQNVRKIKQTFFFFKCQMPSDIYFSFCYSSHLIFGENWQIPFCQKEKWFPRERDGLVMWFYFSYMGDSGGEFFLGLEFVFLWLDKKLIEFSFLFSLSQLYVFIWASILFPLPFMYSYHTS